MQPLLWLLLIGTKSCLKTFTYYGAYLCTPLLGAELVLSKLGLTGIDSLRKSRVSVPGVGGSSPVKKSTEQQLASIATPWLPSLELSTAIVPPGFFHCTWEFGAS
jgi:hypothetical protein